MVIYEVNLSIDKGIYAEFNAWLSEHVREMLQFPGFVQASLLKPEDEDGSDQEKLTIQYQLATKADLDRYFVEFAPKMREAGLLRFKAQFSATRRVFKLQETVLK